MNYSYVAVMCAEKLQKMNLDYEQTIELNRSEKKELLERKISEKKVK